jgi:phage terminase large subunit-like protein
LVPGKVIDYDFVAAEAQRICLENNVSMMTFDPAHAPEFIKACDRLGFKVWVWEGPDKPPSSGLKMVMHSQGKMGMHSTKALWMPRSVQKLEDLILANEIVIDDHQITKWCVGNAAVKPDEQGNSYFMKKVQRGRIDGATVLGMLAGAVIAPEGEKQKTVQMFFA